MYATGEHTPPFEHRLIGLNGQNIDAEVTAAPLVVEGKPAIQVIIRDISEREKVENEMARLEKLNLVAEMAAGVSHEIKNPLTAIRGFTQIIMGKEECTKYKNYFDIILDEIDRANSIISKFLSVAKDKPVNKKLQNLNTVIEKIFPLVQAKAYNTDMFASLELHDVPDLILDEREINQLILNLAQNGFEAMVPGGSLTIKTLRDGQEVVLAVQDQGKGIEEYLIDKIGTPFFTTKDEGTGLGVAIVNGIASRHSAKVEIETNPTGTTVSVRFPLK